MAKFWYKFLKVLGTYSIEEKVISLILFLTVLFLGGQASVELFATPGLFIDSSGQYTEGLINEKATLINPVYINFSEANREISSLVFSGLTKYDPVKKSFTEDIARVNISGDGKVYHFTLREGIYWHDGEKLTADDVYFTYHDVIQDPDFQNPVLRANFDGVEVKLIDESNIEFVLSKPNSFFITNLNIGILPKHLLTGVNVVDLPQNGFNINPVGSGPYKMSVAMEVLGDGRSRIGLTLNEKYYDVKPKIKNIKFHVYPSADDLYKERGTLNVISKLPQDLRSQMESDGRFSFINYELPQYTAVFLNIESLILKNGKVRLALAKAIDKNKMLEIISNKTIVDTPLMELNQEEWLYQQNVDEAKGALFDSGYKMGSDENDPYRKIGDGSNLKLILLVRQVDDQVMADDLSVLIAFLQESWKAIGVEVEAQVVDGKVFSDRIKARDYDMVLLGESLGYNLDTYSYWHSSQANENGLNLSNFRSFGADSQIEKIRATFNADEKEKALKSLADVIATEMPAIFLYRPQYIYATDGKVRNVVLENLAYASDRFSGMSGWCIAKSADVEC